MGIQAVQRADAVAFMGGVAAPPVTAKMEIVITSVGLVLYS